MRVGARLPAASGLAVPRRLFPRLGAAPRSDPVDRVDIQATIYHSMGLDPELALRDHLNRPFPLSEGKVLRRLF